MSLRVAVIDKDLCQPRKCSTECIRFCPLARTGKRAIYMDETLRRPVITQLCTACGICVRKCPFKAITIVNLPSELKDECIHQYGASGFKLFRLPIVKQGKIVGLIGQNGLGKTTIARILSGELRPSFCSDEPKEPREIVKRFRGTELQPYFESLLSGRLRVVHKIQYVEIIPRYVKGTVSEVLMRAASNDVNKLNSVVKMLNMEYMLDRDVSCLSGGELQKLAIAAAILRDSDVYIFDELTTHLDITERLRVCKVVRDVVSTKGKYAIVVEHDLAVLDYLADMVAILYGKPGAYGIVSDVRGSREGINEYLRGYLSSENVLIRDKPITFRLKPPERKSRKEKVLVEWTNIVKRLNGFTLEVEQGCLHRGEIVGVLGPNGIGKTTFARILVDDLKPDEGLVMPHGPVRMSYKPQYVRDYALKYGDLTVRKFLRELCQRSFEDKIVWSELSSGLNLEPLLDREVSTLSGGELQRVVLAGCLLRDADLYVLDEPMAYLDIEQRARVSTIIRRLAEEREISVLVIEHDITMVDYLSDAVIVFSGEPGVHGKASSVLDLRSGMNRFLREQDITFRREPRVGRPRVNKKDSVLDRIQREIGEYYYYVSE